MIRLKVLTVPEKVKIRREKLSSWHKWFAWRPVRLEHDKHEIRWLGWILRKGRVRSDMDDGQYWDWKYAETELDILKQEQ